MLRVNLLRVSSSFSIFLSKFLFLSVASDLAVELLFDPGQNQKASQCQQRPVLQQYLHQLKPQRHLSIGKTVCGTFEMGPFTSVLVRLMKFAGIEPEGLELFLRQVF